MEEYATILIEKNSLSSFAGEYQYRQGSIGKETIGLQKEGHKI